VVVEIHRTIPAAFQSSGCLGRHNSVVGVDKNILALVVVPGMVVVGADRNILVLVVVQMNRKMTKGRMDFVVDNLMPFGSLNVVSRL